MGCLVSKPEVLDKAVDQVHGNKDKAVDGVKAAGSKVGLSAGMTDTAATKVDAALSDKAALKENLSKVLGGGEAAAKEPAAAEAAAAEEPKA